MSISPALTALITQLSEVRDARLGQPITSHRQGIGKLVVKGKQLFRRACQPLINEMLMTQVTYNERLITVLQAVALEIQSATNAALQMRGLNEQRLRRLEEELARLTRSAESVSSEAASALAGAAGRTDRN